jgi:hypothetical protein
MNSHCLENLETCIPLYLFILEKKTEEDLIVMKTVMQYLHIVLTDLATYHTYW